MTWKIPVSITLDIELIEKLDEKRGPINRSRYIRDLIKKDLK